MTKSFVLLIAFLISNMASAALPEHLSHLARQNTHFRFPITVDRLLLSPDNMRSALLRASDHNDADVTVEDAGGGDMTKKFMVKVDGSVAEIHQYLESLATSDDAEIADTFRHVLASYEDRISAMH